MSSSQNNHIFYNPFQMMPYNLIPIQTSIPIPIYPYFNNITEDKNLMYYPIKNIQKSDKDSKEIIFKKNQNYDNNIESIEEFNHFTNIKNKDKKNINKDNSNKESILKDNKKLMIKQFDPNINQKEYNRDINSKKIKTLRENRFKAIYSKRKLEDTDKIINPLARLT